MQQEDNLPSAPLAGEKLTKKQHRLALIMAGLPLATGLILTIMNPAYVGGMLRNTCGLAMVAMILICVGVAYPLFLVSFMISNSAEPHGGIARKIIGYALAVVVIAFCIFPALYLVLLGPAVLVVMESGVMGAP